MKNDIQKRQTSVCKIEAEEKSRADYPSAVKIELTKTAAHNSPTKRSDELWKRIE
jgi:hypothetical protein